MLNIAICDDEAPMRKYVKKCLGEYSIKFGEDINCYEYDCGDALITSKNPHDIILLDYQLDKFGEKNGITTARTLRSSGVDTPIIFLTSHPKVVFSSFEVNTFRFLIKPLDVSKLFKALDDYRKQTDPDASLVIRQSRENIYLSTKQINFVEANGKYCKIHMVDNKNEIDCHETLAQVESRLPPQYFLRCHRSIIVNMRYIYSYNQEGITLKNKQWIPISHSKFNAFQNAFITYSKKFGY